MTTVPADEPPPAPRKGGYYKDDGPGANPPADLASIPDAVPRGEPLHPFANRPYEVFGRTYVPLAELRPYRETGIGSWYGRRFHGAPTSSGEPYDMYALTAAHPTLPIPSYARVTNPANGRSVVVRINDRGPFHAGRVIDLSYAAAYRLGFAQAGSARLEVESIVPGEATLVAAPPPPGARAEEAEPPQPASGVYLQLGAFAGRENAESFRVRLARELGSLADGLRLIGSGGVFRLHIGPYRSREEARPIAERIRSQLSLEPLFVAR
ncbi:MAG: septal ring lytic transglycosylase RlpA family protein [Pseudomonadota bacterium]